MVSSWKQSNSVVPQLFRLLLLLLLFLKQRLKIFPVSLLFLTRILFCLAIGTVVIWAIEANASQFSLPMCVAQIPGDKHYANAGSIIALERLVSGETERSFTITCNSCSGPRVTVAWMAREHFGSRPLSSQSPAPVKRVDSTTVERSNTPRIGEFSHKLQKK